MQRRIGRREARIERSLLVFAGEATDLATMSAAAATALAPSAGRAECASWPLTTVWIVATLLWASATSIIVGSPTTTRGRTRLVPAEPGDHVGRAEAGRLLVVAEHDVDRALQRRG